MRMIIHSHTGFGVVARIDLAAERRRQILEAAASCFARRGFHGATMPDICAAAGLSPGTVYRYFRSKEDLIEALVEADLSETLALISASSRASDTASAIELIADAWLAPMADPVAAAVYLEVGAEGARNARVAAIVRRHDKSVIGALADLLRRGQERGELSPDLDSRLAAEMLSALLDGVASRKALFPETDLGRFAPVLDQMIARLLSSKASGASKTPQ